MNTKRILSFLALLIGVIIIITGFVLFGYQLENDILILDIFVCILIYILFFSEFLILWSNFSDSSHRKIGTIGIRWFFIGIYTVTAIGIMVIGNIGSHWSFSLQLLSHCGLFVFLLLGIISTLSTHDKTAQIHIEQLQDRNGILEMKKAIRDLKNKAQEQATLPLPILERICSLEQELRFLSPTNKTDGHEMEHLFIQTAVNMKAIIINYSMNKESLEKLLDKLEHLLQERKSVYSN